MCMCSLEKIVCVSNHRMDQSISILAEPETVSAFAAVVFSVVFFVNMLVWQIVIDLIFKIREYIKTEILRTKQKVWHI